MNAIPQQQQQVVLASAADTQFSRPLAVMLRSAVTRLAPGRRAVVFVVADGIEETDRAKIMAGVPEGTAIVRWLEPDLELLRGVPLWGRMRATTYTKLLLPELVPATVEKLIWLDCDLIVRRDLGALWDVPLEGLSVLAAQDAVVPFVSSRFGVSRYRELGIPSDTPYFNAGVMVVDLAAWRRHAVAIQALAYVREQAEHVYFWDQEGLNAVLAGRVGALDQRWNRSVAAALAGDETWIVHVTGSLKPWEYHGYDDVHEDYFRHLDGTGFAGERPLVSVRRRVLGAYAGSRWRQRLAPVERCWMRSTRRRTWRRFEPQR